MATGDRFILTATIDYGSFQTMENVFAYEQTAGSGNASTLSASFISDRAPDIADILSGDAHFSQIEVINVDDTSDFHLEAVAIPGVIGGEVLPPFVAAAFEYVRADRAVHNGRKSFGPLSESSQIGGNATSSFAVDCSDLAIVLAADITDTTTSSAWTPKIFRRPGTYASGVVAAPGAFYGITGVVYKRISSQNTRKFTS